MKYVIQDVLNKNFNFNINYEAIRKQIMIISSKLHSLTNNRDFYEDKIDLLKSVKEKSVEDYKRIKQCEKKLVNCNHKIEMLNNELIELQLKLNNIS